MKLTSVQSIGSFHTSHSISIIPLSITLREGWNLSLVDESERIQQILFGLYPAAQVLVISPTARDSDQSERALLLLWRSWVVSFMSWKWHSISIELSWWFPLWGFVETLREGTHSLIPTPRQAQEAFKVDENSTFVRAASKKLSSCVVFRGICENVVDFNQIWRPFILWMPW